MKTNMTPEELLDHAKAEYRKGTVYICALTLESQRTVTYDLKYIDRVPHNGLITDGMGGSVYFEGRWAKIVSKPVKPMSQELEEARRIIYSD